MFALLKKENREMRRRFIGTHLKFRLFGLLFEYRDFHPIIEAESEYKKASQKMDADDSEYEKYLLDSIFFFEMLEDMEMLYFQFCEDEKRIAGKEKWFFLNTDSVAGQVAEVRRIFHGIRAIKDRIAISDRRLLDH